MFIALYLGRKNNNNSKTTSRLCTMSQYKLWKDTITGINTRTKDARILNAVSGKCEAIPMATVPQSCTWQGPSEVGCSSWRRLVL